MACDFELVAIPCCKESGNCGDYGCVSWQTNVFSWEKLGIGRALTFLVVEGIFFYFIIALIELKVFQSIEYFIQKWRNKIVRLVKGKTISSKSQMKQEDLEEDVKAEELRIQNTPLEKVLSSNILVFKDLTKRYSSNNHLAVNHLNLAVPKGECFGLLGINGAGKTTTFKMLTGSDVKKKHSFFKIVFFL